MKRELFMILGDDEYTKKMTCLVFDIFPVSTYTDVIIR